MISTTGTWDPNDRRILFLAADVESLHVGTRSGLLHGHVLAALNELWSDGMLSRAESMIDAGTDVLIDSGIFWLASQHARTEGIDLQDAFTVPPQDLNNFDQLYTRYIEVHERLGDRPWGYIELDQGGPEYKRANRAKLNDLGIFPIPVWHPLIDGLDYFEELASTHDRICLGNIASVPSPVRTRILHDMCERHRDYPDLWVHVLGMNPSDVFHSLTFIDSADASSWVGPVRWGQFPHQSHLSTYGESLRYEYRYCYEDDRNYGSFDDPDDPRGRKKALRMSALSMNHTQHVWRLLHNTRAAEFDATTHLEEI